LAQLAGNAVRGGMDHQAALDAITVNPGKAFGVPGYDGLKPGNAGDLVAWSGDPLEIGSRPLLVVVNGEVQPLDSRQKALLRRYRELPGSPVPALTLPE
ncbi:MAG: amidohydrolase, partial [Myxococcales bacterium]|nr:amidohydrolase [Myxococcales bacterium]